MNVVCIPKIDVQVGGERRWIVQNCEQPSKSVIEDCRYDAAMNYSRVTVEFVTKPSDAGNFWIIGFPIDAIFLNQTVAFESFMNGVSFAKVRRAFQDFFIAANVSLQDMLCDQIFDQ